MQAIKHIFPFGGDMGSPASVISRFVLENDSIVQIQYPQDFWDYDDYPVAQPLSATITLANDHTMDLPVSTQLVRALHRELVAFLDEV